MALIFHIKCILKCHLQFVPICPSLKFCCLVKCSRVQKLCPNGITDYKDQCIKTFTELISRHKPKILGLSVLKSFMADKLNVFQTIVTPELSVKGYKTLWERGRNCLLQAFYLYFYNMFLILYSIDIENNQLVTFYMKNISRGCVVRR